MKGVRLPIAARILLVLTPLSITAARLHAHAVDAVDAAPEMNRCLSLVNVVAGKKQTSRRSLDPAAAADAGRRPDASHRK